ncbi:MAG: hypothetical protein IPO27_15050 [Bacteroidetes bacterium]|nr:hypothetical protein [Bacteroidota bacterium]
MKKDIKQNGRTLTGAILVALSLISNVMVAQFQPATINETNYPIIQQANSSRTGNDIQSETIEGTKYEMAVTVWEATNGQGLGYTFTNLTTSTVISGIAPLPVNTSFSTPDVCLMQRNNNWHALVAYTEGFPSFGHLMILKFDIITHVWTHVSTTQLGPVVSTINIDSDQHEHFFIVWDENLNPNIVVKGAAGAFNAVSNTVVVCMTNYQFPQFKDANGNLVQYPYLRPDVSVMDLPISNNNPGQVKITFEGGQCLSEPTAIQSL